MLKIGIVPYFLYRDSEGEWCEKIGKPVYKWEDILKVNKRKNITPIDKSFFDEVKMLEKNKNLEKEIMKFRQEFKVPSDVVVRNNKQSSATSVIKYESKKEKNWDWHQWKGAKEEKKKMLYFERILKTFDMPQWLKDLGIYEQIETLLVAGVVIGRMSRDIVHLEGTYPMNEVSISIYSRVSKGALMKYIEDHWAELNKMIATLPKKGKYIAARDKRIFELREEKKTYREIADIIAREFSEEDGDESIIKTAYQRTKEKIDSMFVRRGKGKKET